MAYGGQPTAHNGPFRIGFPYPVRSDKLMQLILLHRHISSLSSNKNPQNIIFFLTKLGITKKSKIQKKITFSENLKTTKKNKNAILLVLPFEEISLQPDFSSPPRFRIQRGWSERDGGRRRTKLQTVIHVYEQLG